PAAEPVPLPFTPTPVPTALREPGRTRRFLSGLASLAAVLVIILIAVVLFTGRATHTGSTSGLSWTATESRLSDIAMVSPTEGWAIGATTTCYVYDANLETHYSNADCSHVDVVLMHYQQGVWSPVSLPVVGQLQSISMDSATDGWAVGVSGDHGIESVLLHYDGQRWQEVPNQLGLDLTKVQMLSATDGWAMGMGGSEPGTSLLHYDGQSWTVQPWPAIPGIESNGEMIINDLEMTSPSDGWAAGSLPSITSDPFQQEALILHYTGGQWTVSGTFQYGGLTSIAMASPTDGWAVGWQDASTQTLVNGTPQSVQDSGTPQSPIDRQKPLALHYTDGEWQPVAVSFGTDPTMPWSFGQGRAWQVLLPSATDGWMLGPASGVLLHYNGTTWQLVHLPAPTIKNTLLALSGLDILSPTEGWAVGEQEATRGCPVAPPTDGGVEVCATPLLLHYQHNAWTIYHP
ncbi:MAG TPA: hypothetical protein VFU32_02840, partial [Ktedonobacterales bacterium]|nr:hypothetical protein [Ktedonobacterales bacterium]